MSVESRRRGLEPFRARAWAIAALLAAAAAIPGQSDACELRLVRAPDTVRIDYDPFVYIRPSGLLDVGLANDGDTACRVELRIRTLLGEPLREVDLDGVGVTFRPREGAAIVPGPNEPNVFDLDIPPGLSATAGIDALVATEAVPEAGEYSENLMIEIVAKDGDRLLDPIPLTLVLQSPPRAQVSIAGAAGAFGSSESVEVLDMGEARTGLSKRAFLQVRANTDSRLSIQSENGGVLRRSGDVSEESVITYVMSLDGEPLDLRHMILRDVDPPRDVRGQSIPFDIVLGQVGSQMSGRYTDVLMIDIDPR